MIKQWPKDNTEVLSFTDLIDPVRKALEIAYAFKRKKIKSIPYDGYNTPTLLAGFGPPDERLTEEGLAYDEERDRDALDTLLNISFNLGMEQGIRMQRRDSESDLKMRDIYKRLYDTLHEKVYPDGEPGSLLYKQRKLAKKNPKKTREEVIKLAAKEFKSVLNKAKKPKVKSKR